MSVPERAYTVYVVKESGTFVLGSGDDPAGIGERAAEALADPEALSVVLRANLRARKQPRWVGTQVDPLSDVTGA